MNLALATEQTNYKKKIWQFDDMSAGILSQRVNNQPSSYLAYEQENQSANHALLSSTRLQTLLDALPAGVVVLDGKGVVNECNPAAISLLGEPLLGESWRDVIERSFNPMPSGQDVVTNDGRIVNISTCPLGNNLPGQIILLQDVTTNRHLQVQLDQQKRLATMGQMAAQLAHQIRTPIASALLYASHLKKSNLSESNRLRFADKILNRIKNLENLIKDMLLFSKNGMEQGVNLKINELFETIQYSIELSPQTQISFNNNIENKSQNFRLHGNQNLLVSALLNLIENAEQASQSKSEMKEKTITTAVIDVELVSRQKNYIDFIITDNGSGVSKKIINKIFEPFYTSKNQGTGLGLAVVKAISHGHRGDLWLEKTSAKGSTFVLRLPVVNIDS
ncbi:MAG: ATP-binding protein [Pseudomonadota bacterium]